MKALPGYVTTDKISFPPHYLLPISSYCSMLTDCLTTPVQSKLDTWRKRVTVLDKVTTAL